MRDNEKVEDNVRIHFQRDIFSNNVEVFLIKNIPGKRLQAKIEWVEVEATTSQNRMEPTLIVPESNSRFSGEDYKPSRFIRSLMESLEDSKILAKQPEAKMLEGELKATGAHLQDMRSMVQRLGDHVFPKGENNE